MEVNRKDEMGGRDGNVDVEQGEELCYTKICPIV